MFEAQSRGHDQTDLRCHARGCGQSKVKRKVLDKVELEDLDLIIESEGFAGMKMWSSLGGALRTSWDIQAVWMGAPRRS